MVIRATEYENNLMYLAAESEITQCVIVIVRFYICKIVGHALGVFKDFFIEKLYIKWFYWKRRRVS